MVLCVPDDLYSLPLIVTDSNFWKMKFTKIGSWVFANLEYNCLSTPTSLQQRTPLEYLVGSWENSDTTVSLSDPANLLVVTDSKRGWNSNLLVGIQWETLSRCILKIVALVGAQYFCCWKAGYLIYQCIAKEPEFLNRTVVFHNIFEVAMHVHVWGYNIFSIHLFNSWTKFH